MTRNPKALWAFVLALAALGVLAGGLAAAHYSGDVGLYQAIPAIPIGLLLAFMSQALRKLAGTLNRTGTVALFTNQLREKIGVMRPSTAHSPRDARRSRRA